MINETEVVVREMVVMSQDLSLVKANRNFLRLFVVLGFLLTLFLAYSVYQIGYAELLVSTKEVLSKAGVWGPILLILIQMIQVIYPIIPGGLTMVVGQIIFGIGWGFVYGFIGITIGSIINFFLARKFGKTFARAFVREETYQKYHDWITKGKRFDYLVAIALLLPGFPDDFLCMVAGLTNMTFRKFLIIYFTCKPLTLFFYGTGGAKVTEWFLTKFFLVGA